MSLTYWSDRSKILVLIHSLSRSTATQFSQTFHRKTDESRYYPVGWGTKKTSLLVYLKTAKFIYMSLVNDAPKEMYKKWSNTRTAPNFQHISLRNHPKRDLVSHCAYLDTRYQLSFYRTNIACVGTIRNGMIYSIRYFPSARKIQLLVTVNYILRAKNQQRGSGGSWVGKLHPNLSVEIILHRTFNISPRQQASSLSLAIFQHGATTYFSRFPQKGPNLAVHFCLHHHDVRQSPYHWSTATYPP